MQYFLKIDGTSKELEGYKDQLQGAPFWNKPILISKKLFDGIVLHKKIMIMADDEEMITEVEDFNTLFGNTIELNYRETVQHALSSSIHCDMAACFKSDEAATTPF